MAMRIAANLGEPLRTPFQELTVTFPTIERICDLATERFRTWTQAVGEALERGLDPERDDALDEVMRVLRDVARTDATTGAEAELDLQAMETMSSIRLNSMGILGYWRPTRKAEGAGQAS